MIGTVENYENFLVSPTRVVGLVVFTFGYETNKKWGLVLNRVVMVKWDKCVILGDGAEQKKQKKCFYYLSVFIDNEGLGGSQWHTHCGHIYYGKILAPQNFFTPFCYNYNVVKCDW